MIIYVGIKHFFLKNLRVRDSGGGIINLDRDDTSIVDGNPLGRLRFSGDDPTAGAFNRGAEIRGEAAGTWSTNNYPTELQFYTTATNTDLLALKLDSSQNATFSGDVTTSGHYFADTHFRSSDSNATLSATGGGGVYLRPDGFDQTSSQVFIAASTGDASITGITTSKAFRTASNSDTYSLITRDNLSSNYPLYVQNVVNDAGSKIARFAYGSATANAGTQVFAIGADGIFADVLLDMGANILPSTDSTYDLGSTTLRWANVWADNINGDPPVNGSGTADRVALWTDSNTLGSSNIVQDGTNVAIGITSADYRLDVGGAIGLSGRLHIDTVGDEYKIGSDDYTTDQTSGVMVRPADNANPTDGDALFVVRSGGGSPRLFVEHSGVTGTSNSTFTVGATSTRGNGSVVLSSTGDSYITNQLALGKSAASYQLDVDGSIKASSQGRFANGSAAAPAYSFDTDSDTGMYRVTTNALGFATAGTNALTIGASQNSTFAGDIRASVDSSHDIGTDTVRFANVYADNFHGLAKDLEVTSNDTFTGTYSLLWHSGADVYSSTFMTINGATDTFSVPNISTTGDITIGADSGGERKLIIHGGASGSIEGGDIELHLAADYDSTYAYYRIDAYADDFRIGREGTTDILLDSAGNTRFYGTVGINMAPPSAYQFATSYTQTDPNADFRFAHFIDANFSGADNTTADREQGGVFIDIDSSADGDASNEHRLYGIYLDQRFTGFSDSVTGVYSRVESNNGTEKTANIQAVHGIAIHDSGVNGGVSSIYGGKFETYVEDDGDMDNSYGAFGRVLVNSTRAVNVDATFGGYFEVQTDSPSAITYGTMAAIRGVIDNNEGAVPTFGNQYLLFGTYQGTKGSNAYGLYLEAEDKNYLSSKLGIGVSDPDNTLDIDSSFTNSVQIRGTGTYSLFSYHDSGGVGWATGSGTSYDNLVYLDAANDIIHFYTAQSNRMRIDSLGHVGIGISPAYRLHVYHPTTNVVARFESGDASAYIELHDDSSGTYGCLLGHAAGTNDLFHVSDANVTRHFRIVTASAGVGVKGADFYTDGDYGVQIHGSGNSSEGGHLTLKKASSYTYQYCIDNFQDNLRFFRQNDDGTAGVVYANIASDGDLQIARYLEHYGDTNSYLGWSAADDFRIVTGGRELVRLDEGTDPDIAKFMTDEFRMYSNGDFHADGDVVAYSTTASSDKRLKKNIKPINNALDIVDKLQGVHFNWKKDDKKSIGYIAQDVEKILPEMVSEKTHFDEGEFKTVNYAAMVSIMGEAIKELKAEVEQLKKQINGSS